MEKDELLETAQKPASPIAKAEVKKMLAMVCLDGGLLAKEASCLRSSGPLVR